MVNDKHVISLQNDRGSSYQAYISVQNELVAAYNELRDELAKEKFGITLCGTERSINRKQSVRFIRNVFLRQNLKNTEKKRGK